MNSVATKEILIKDIEHILRCLICLELPRGEVVQCRNGHIMCDVCARKMFFDSYLHCRSLRCPVCRIKIGRNPIRNKVVERILALLPLECQFCENKFSKSSIKIHELEECEARSADCKYKYAGCKWKGAVSMRFRHESQCSLLGALARRGKEFFSKIFQNNNMINIMVPIEIFDNSSLYPNIETYCSSMYNIYLE